MTVGLNVRIGESRIEGAGRGVFATRDIQAHAHITKYEGRVVPTTHHIDQHETVYAIDFNNICIIGYADKRNWTGYGAASLINDALCPALQPLPTSRVCPVTRNGSRKLEANYQPMNCILRRSGSKDIHAYACRDIKAGEELYTTYRWSYWQNKMNTDIAQEHTLMHEITEEIMHEYGTFYELPISCHYVDALSSHTLQVRWMPCNDHKGAGVKRCPCDRSMRCAGKSAFVTVYDHLQKKVTILCEDCHDIKVRYV